MQKQLERQNSQDEAKTKVECIKIILQNEGMMLGYIADKLGKIPHIEKIIEGDYSTRMIYGIAEKRMSKEDMNKLCNLTINAFTKLSKIYETFENHYKTMRASTSKFSNIDELEICFRAFYKTAVEFNINYEHSVDMAQALDSKNIVMDCDLLSYLFKQLSQPYVTNLHLMYAKPDHNDWTHLALWQLDQSGEVIRILDITGFISPSNKDNKMSEEEAIKNSFFDLDDYPRMDELRTSEMQGRKTAFYAARELRLIEMQNKYMTAIANRASAQTPLDIAEKYRTTWLKNENDMDAFYVYARLLNHIIRFGSFDKKIMDRLYKDKERASAIFGKYMVEQMFES